MENNIKDKKSIISKCVNEDTTLANTSVKGISVTQGAVRNYTLFDIIQSEEVKEMYCESYKLLFNYFQGQSGPEIALICHNSDMIKNLKYTGSTFYMKANHVWREVSIYEVIDFIYIIMVNFFKKLIEFLKVRFNSGYKLCTASQVYRLFENKKILSTAIAVLKPKIFDHSFHNKLDNDVYVIPFTNGMFDLDTCLFREYKDDDYVSETVGYGCEITTFDRAEKMFMNLFNTNEEYEYAAFWIGSFLDNRMHNDKLFWLIGDGRNGKSVLLNVLADVMGNLHHALPSNYFSKESSTFNKANVELIKFQKQR